VYPLDLQAFFDRIKLRNNVVVDFSFLLLFSLLKSVKLVDKITPGAGELIRAKGLRPKLR